MHRAVSGLGNRWALRAGAGLAAAGTAVAMSLAVGVTAQAAPGSTPRPVPGPGHHHFSAAASHVGAAGTIPDRVARVEQALQSSSSGLQQAYDVAPLFANHIDGTGLTIATLVSFGDKSAQSFIDQYDASNGLPAATIQTIEPAGAVPACTDPGVNTSDCNSWGGETDLDISMIHTLAPGAKILIIATPVSETQGITGFPEMMTAMDYTVANHLANVISMSLGTPEDDFSTSTQLHGLDSHFKNATDNGVTVLASSGDDGADGLQVDGTTHWGRRVVSFPADETYVTAVGGTVLSLDGSGNRTRPDVLWSSSGGGVSHEFGIPAWQQSTATATGAAGRALPDITMEGTSGTSEASPLMAAIVGLADQSAGRNLGLINPALYAIGPNGTGSGVVDVTSGCNSTATVTGYCAGAGYDIVSGWGTIDAAKFVPALVAASNQGGDTVTVTNPGAQTGTVGTAATLQINATDSASGQTLTYSATGLPAGLTISGSGLISGTPTTAGSGTVTVKATDTTGASGTAGFTWTINPNGGGGITNGGFETGDLAGWTTSGAATTVTTSGAHSGTHAAMLGASTPTNGDSSIAQTFTAPSGTGTLSFWYNATCPDTVTYDWATATLTDNTTGTTSTVLPQTCVSSSGWTHVSSSVVAGHSYTLTLTSHDDNYSGDPTYTLYDDVALS